jgi:hypothetical protein
LEFQTVRIMRDDAKIADMLAGVTAFLKELADLEAEMRERMKQ